MKLSANESLAIPLRRWTGFPSRDSNLYTCSSSSNREGPGVNSTTLFRWENNQFLY